MTPLPPFAIERYFAVHEFAVPYLLCASDVEPVPMQELLSHADDELRELWDTLVLGYTETLGSPLLRAEIAGLYETAEADDVIAVVGASEALYLLFSALVRPGDHVIALWPAYQSLYDLARSQGADVELIELRPEDGWALDLDRIAAALRPTTRAVVVNLPHNPTGMHLTAAEFEALAALVERSGATLVCDEVYRGLEYDATARLPAAIDISPRAVSVGVLSKSYALAGLRVGWLATRDRVLLDAAAQVRDYTSLCSPAPSEVLGAIALRARDALLERSRAIIAAQPADRRRAARRARGPARLGTALGGVDRLPPLPRCRGHRRVQRAAGGRAGRPSPARPGVRLRRRALPARVRAREPPRGGRAPRPAPARMTVYDRIGTSYAATRRPDPRIERQIDEALGDARRVVNVGAGAGAYEPRDREVVAVEPSAVMIAQRPPDAAPAVQGAAEALPFADDSFDAALAVLTMHHWSDWRAGIAELRRVARGRIVMLTFDPAYIARYWLVRDYLPDIAARDEERFPPLATVAEAMGGAEAIPVPIADDCSDGFLCATWKRPLAYLDETVRANISSFALLAPDVVAAGLARLERDVADGTWAERNADLIAGDEADFGYRLLVTRTA